MALLSQVGGGGGGDDDDDGGGGNIGSQFDDVKSATDSIDETVDTTASERIAEAREDEARRNRTLEEAGGGSDGSASSFVDDGGGSDNSAGSLVDKAVSGTTGLFDFAAGSVDESVARTFDDNAGGGLIAGFDESSRESVDTALDNEVFSVQDTVRGGLRGIYGAAAGRDVSDQELLDAYGGAWEGVRTATDGTVVDPATDLVGEGADLLFAPIIGAGTKGLTGIDTENNTVEGEVGAEAAFDTLLTVGTAGAGTALAKGAGKFGDEGLGLASRLFGGSDEAAGVTDDAGLLVDEVAGATDDAVRTAVEGTESGAGGLRGFLDDGATGIVDEAATVGDDLAGATDDAVRTAVEGAESGADEGGSLLSRLFGRGGDDAAQAGARVGDDAATVGDDAATVGDDLASTGDDLAEGVVKTGDDVAEGGSWWDNLWKPSKKQLGIGAGLTLGAGAVSTLLDDAPEEITTENGAVLTRAKSYEPTDERPNGGVLYEVVDSGGNSVGYWLLLEIRGRNLIVLDSSGEPRQAKISVDQFRELKSGGNAGGAA